MKKYQWAQWGLVLNMAGFVLLFVAFQATSSNLSIYTNNEKHTTSLCLGSHALLVGNNDGATIIGLGREDPSCSQGNPTAIINTDFPWVAKVGVICIFLSFWMQFKSIDRTEANLTKTQLRALRNLGLFLD